MENRERRPSARRRATMLGALLLGAAGLLLADDPPAAPAPAVPPSVIDAAKAAKAKRKSGSARQLTNEDVKKSKGRIIERKESAADPKIEVKPSEIEVLTAARAERAALETAHAAAKERVELLQKELLAIEQRYYEEPDLDLRDGEITRRFAAAAANLKAAQADLDALASKLNPPDSRTPPPTEEVP